MAAQEGGAVAPDAGSTIGGEDEGGGSVGDEN